MKRKEQCINKICDYLIEDEVNDFIQNLPVAVVSDIEANFETLMGNDHIATSVLWLTFDGDKETIIKYLNSLIGA